jgi:ribonuclease HI
VSDIRIYTDGGCSGNPGPGAWAYIILSGETRLSASEAAPDTTNNRMELAAVIAALEQVTRRREWDAASLEIYTDSEYVQKGITRWIRAWEANGWRTSGKRPVKNQDLWKRLRQLSAGRSVQWHWLAGHAGHPLNEECDRLVRRAIAGLKG